MKVKMRNKTNRNDRTKEFYRWNIHFTEGPKHQSNSN